MSTLQPDWNALAALANRSRSCARTNLEQAARAASHGDTTRVRELTAEALRQLETAEQAEHDIEEAWQLDYWKLGD